MWKGGEERSEGWRERDEVVREGEDEGGGGMREERREGESLCAAEDTDTNKQNLQHGPTHSRKN